MNNRDVISLDQFTADDIQAVFKTADIIVGGSDVAHTMAGKIASLIFYEPSTRTFSSFCAAVKKLGGQTIEHQNPTQTSSAVKGETLEDTVRVLENYSDILIIRHPEVGAAQRAAEAIEIPVINAGDGAGEHPTQALMDMYTIQRRFGTLNNLTLVMVGDLKFGRTIHSLLKGLAKFQNNTVYLLAPDLLKLDPEFITQLSGLGLTIKEISTEEEMPKDAHVWYWTRVQKERFNNLDEYEALKHRFILTPDLLQRRGNDNLILMHPLPRVGEIDTQVDADKRAVYLTDQIKNGMYIRMALVGRAIGKF